MKRTLSIVIASIGFLVVSNLYYYYDTYKWQINTHSNILEKDIATCSEIINSYFAEAETNVLLMLNEEELGGLFKFQFQNIEVQKRIELLFNRYSSVLNKLSVYDIKGNFYALSSDSNNNLITNVGKGKRKEFFKPHIITLADKHTILYIQPLYSETHIFGYVEFSLDLNDFYKNLFKSFYIEKHQFQWIINKDNNILYSPIHGHKIIQSETIATKENQPEIHSIEINGRKTKVISVTQTLTVGTTPVIIVFSMPIKPITDSIVKNSFFVALISFVVILLIAFSFYKYVVNNRNTEQRLSQSEEALNKMLHYLPIGTVLSDSKDNIKLVNKVALKLFDCEDEDFLLDQVSSDKLLFEKKKLVETVNISDSSKKYVIDIHNDEKQVILSEKTTFYNQNVKYFLQFFFEITDNDLNLAVSDNDNPKTTFIANISHELRTPLNGIIGMTDIVLSSSNMLESEKEMLKVVKRSADTLLALINDILDFSKIEAGKLEVESIPVNIATEIEQTIKSFETIAKERNIKIETKINTELPDDFLCDPLRFRQVLNNLIGNAIKFTPAGFIQLSVEKSKNLNGNPALKFAINDTGIGIKKEKLKSIFNSFVQEDESTTRKFGGTGLGTSISKNLVRLMGGEIWANSPSAISTSQIYPGAEFCFTLPFVTKRTQKKLDYSYILSWTQINALIITDDSLQVQNIIKNFLALGINHKVMAPSQETIVMLKNNTNLQILVIDQRPDFNGIDFLQQLFNHNLQDDFLILLQSSDYEMMNTNIGKKLGADIYLRKPVKLNSLRQFLLRHFHSITTQDSLTGQIVPEDLKILVAEDNLFNQRVAQNLFKKLGYEIDLAENGRDAINKFKKNKYNLIFMDLMMPELDGFDATKELKCYDESCPIIAMTANNDFKQRELAFKSGMDDFIVKPAQKEEITRMIIKWCSH